MTVLEYGEQEVVGYNLRSGVILFFLFVFFCFFAFLARKQITEIKGEGMIAG